MPKVLGGSLAAHRDEVRARVFEALRGLLYERGFDAVTLAGVAAAAGVGRTS
ncbi:TetR family transcriptional regulator, partial [Pseudonocardia kujensis]|uniref:TetR family transcriptional regulator n=1 Tax=Pseudonocardia kujensis TaxID=1128675 RepID=UPI001E613D70